MGVLNQMNQNPSDGGQLGLQLTITLRENWFQDVTREK